MLMASILAIVVVHAMSAWLLCCCCAFLSYHRCRHDSLLFSFVLCCIGFVVSSCMFALPPPTPASLSVSASGLMALCPPVLPLSGCMCCVLSPWLICVGSVCKSALFVFGNVGWHFGLLTMSLDCNQDFFSHHQPRAGLLLVFSACMLSCCVVSS